MLKYVSLQWKGILIGSERLILEAKQNFCGIYDFLGSRGIDKAEKKRGLLLSSLLNVT